MRALSLLPIALALSGCVTPTLYQWGGYDQALYAGYKDPTKMEAMRLKLEAHMTEMEKSKQKMAPGLYAELGTLYLQAGSADKAAALYTKERDAWPESSGLMTAMIQNIERREKSKKEAQQ
ncbi:DUF4810 domain-containing protein [Polaromonas sp. SM01]|uniref:DUF4810 domain-containing protein n=1 Tax=Polaromonas sp. SM01 TaxID=3085630 RepID=UPI002980B5D8|nr:DUF4810 domain-containing protein [Polaromonas sp. SM01]MDW5441127.1 DUF4810 domain-containing protein [Polaromonas sp. SM01]